MIDLNIKKVYKEYNNGSTLKEIADKYDSTVDKLQRRFRKNDLHIRDRSEASKLRKLQRDIKEGANWSIIFDDYKNGYSINGLVRKHNISFNRVRRELIMNNIHIRTFKEAQINSVRKGTHVAPQKGKKMEKHSSWRGGINIYVDGKGYKRKMIYDGKRYRPYAQYIIMKKNNMKIFPKGFCVHHKDLDTLNDDNNNLVFMTISEHSTLHNEARRK